MHDDELPILPVERGRVDFVWIRKWKSSKLNVFS